jgi:hypothetical protein
MALKIQLTEEEYDVWKRIHEILSDKEKEFIAFYESCYKNDSVKYPFGNPKDWSNESLLNIGTLLNFWAADAHVKIAGLENPESPNWWREYQRGRFASLPENYKDPYFLGGLYLATDYNSDLVMRLIVLAVTRLFIWKEILHRVDTHRFGRIFFEYLSEHSESALKMLFDTLLRAIHGYLKRNPHRLKNPSAKKLIRALKLPPLQTGFKNETEETYSDRDVQNNVILDLHSFFDEIQKNYEWPKEAPDSIFLGPFQALLPALSNSDWNQRALEMFDTELHLTVQAFLPFLKGDMERTPLKVVFDSNHKRGDERWKEEIEKNLRKWLNQDDDSKIRTNFTPGTPTRIISLELRSRENRETAEPMPENADWIEPLVDKELMKEVMATQTRPDQEKKEEDEQILDIEDVLNRIANERKKGFKNDILLGIVRLAHDEKLNNKEISQRLRISLRRTQEYSQEIQSRFRKLYPSFRPSQKK